jgi:hypothetical protein
MQSDLRAAMGAAGFGWEEREVEWERAGWPPRAVPCARMDSTWRARVRCAALARRPRLRRLPAPPARPPPGIRPLNKPKFLSAHRWAAAYTANPLGQACVAEPGERWAAAGDFCLGPGLQAAVESGAAAAEAVAAMLRLPPPL